MQRGYSIMPPSTPPAVKGASPHANVLIKEGLPARGVVSSNPKRTERLLHRGVATGMLTDVKVHTDCGWGVVIHTADYDGMRMFIASVPMGAAGAGFAFFEIFAAGAQAIIRYGSNDRQVTMENLRDVTIVDKVDNLTGRGLVADGGFEQTPVIHASPLLVASMIDKAGECGSPVKTMICHNLEDYHAFNFPNMFQTGSKIRDKMQRLETDSSALHCWDMETGALFWRAKQFGGHAATALQNLIKKPGMTPYDGEHGRISLEMEVTFYRMIFDTLRDFKAQDNSGEVTSTEPMGRVHRIESSNDFIGVEGFHEAGLIPDKTAGFQGVKWQYPGFLDWGISKCSLVFHEQPTLVWALAAVPVVAIGAFAIGRASEISDR